MDEQPQRTKAIITATGRREAIVRGAGLRGRESLWRLNYRTVSKMDSKRRRIRSSHSRTVAKDMAKLTMFMAKSESLPGKNWSFMTEEFSLRGQGLSKLQLHTRGHLQKGAVRPEPR
jgi:hypothetical protein